MFWNTNKNKNIDDYLIDLVKNKSIDIIILAEYNNDVDNLCRKLYLKDLNFKKTQTFEGCKRINFLCKEYYKDEVLRENAHYTIKRIYNAANDYIVVAVHFPSKLNANSHMRDFISRELINDLNKAEKEVGHSNTLIIGDFNCNPFESTMINADCINAIPCRDIVKKNSRKVSKQQLNFFYNPMWNFFGDNILPYGTYYYDK